MTDVTPIEPIHRTTARVLPVNAEGQVLLLFGCDPARPDSPYWFTIGGVVEPGETLEQAAVRELREETGIEVGPDELGSAFHRGSNGFSYDGRAYVSHATFFALLVDDPSITFDGLEPAEVGNIFDARWWLPEELVSTVTVSNPHLPEIAAAAVASLREDAA